MSSQDFSPAPYPLCAGDGIGTGDSEAAGHRRERYWLHLLLLALTLVTTTVVGAAMQTDFSRNQPYDTGRVFETFGWIWQRPASLAVGLPFSLTLLAILMAHEMGHYLAATYHGVDASLPYFVPSPVMGTFGAFIRVRSPIYSRRALFDIGVAGPIAGFVFLLPALSIGLAFSKVMPGIAALGSGRFGVPALQSLLSAAIFPGVRSADLYLHPVARAAWVGMFATALNLLPIGQLDGGHILYSLFPRHHRTVSIVICLILLPLGVFWPWWLVWGAVLLWKGRGHPPIFDAAELGAGRRRLAWLSLALFILCFTYAPITLGQ